MSKQLYFRLELVWWAISLIVAVLVVGPIYLQLGEYPFLWDNVIFIIAFITFSRLIFLLKYSLIADKRNLKVGIIFLCVIMAFLLIQKLNGFQLFLDEDRMTPLLEGLAMEDRKSMYSYIKTQMMFFGVGSVISCILLPFRLVLSIWRRWNGFED